MKNLKCPECSSKHIIKRGKRKGNFGMNNASANYCQFVFSPEKSASKEDTKQLDNTVYNRGKLRNST